MTPNYSPLPRPQKAMTRKTTRRARRHARHLDARQSTVLRPEDPFVKPTRQAEHPTKAPAALHFTTLHTSSLIMNPTLQAEHLARPLDVLQYIMLRPDDSNTTTPPTRKVSIKRLPKDRGAVPPNQGANPCVQVGFLGLDAVRDHMIGRMN